MGEEREEGGGEEKGGLAYVTHDVVGEEREEMEKRREVLHMSHTMYAFRARFLKKVFSCTVKCAQKPCELYTIVWRTFLRTTCPTMATRTP